MESNSNLTLNIGAVSETEWIARRRKVTKMLVVAVVLGCVALAGSQSKNWSEMASDVKGDMSKISLANRDTGARGDVIGPDTAAAATQKEIYDNEKILKTAHGQAKAIWKGVYDQYKTTVQSANAMTLRQYTSMVYAQVHFHIDATAENVHLFIEDAAWGLYISYLHKSGWVAADTVGTTTKHGAELLRLKEELVDVRSRLEGLVRRDATNAPIAASKLSASNAAKSKYNSLVTTGNQQRAAWLSDLQARANANSMTFLEHLHSIHLFTLYKITKTAELVQEYIWLINYTDYLRFQYGHAFVMEKDLMSRLGELREATDKLMELL